MRIAVTGTHSTGKTTLVNRLGLLEEFKDYHLSYSNTRDLKSKGIEINSKGENYDITQELVLTFHLKDLLKPRLICDRCLVDGLAYTQFLHSKGKVSIETMELFGQLASGFIHQYDIIFYSPIRKKVEDDGLRDLDESFRLGVDMIIKNHLLPNLVNCFELPSDNLEENIKFIQEKVQELQNTK